MDQEFFYILRVHSGIEQISKKHSIVDDLGFDGDDADKLYYDLFDNYGIELKRIYHIEEYFHSEGELCDPLYFLNGFYVRLVCALSLLNVD